MSHAAPSCAGFAPRHSTSGVTTQKFGMGEPRSFAHPAGAAGTEKDGKPLKSTNRNAAIQVSELTMSISELRRDHFHLTVLIAQLQGSRRASRQHLNVGRVGFATRHACARHRRTSQEPPLEQNGRSRRYSEDQKKDRELFCHRVTCPR